jgi:hypothetical protein
LEYQLRRIKKQVPTYLRDAQEEVDSLRVMGSLPSHARLITLDATSMHTSIEPALGISTVKAWLIEYERELPKGFPSHIIID